LAAGANTAVDQGLIPGIGKPLTWQSRFGHHTVRRLLVLRGKGSEETILFRCIMSRYFSSNWTLWLAAAFVLLIAVIKVLATNGTAINMPAQAPAQGTLSSIQAKSHIGENATVCGNVVSTHYGGGTLTLIYLDKDWPHGVFTISIWGEDWGKFVPSPRTWKGKQICVTGVINRYYDLPNIVAKSPGQISVK